MAGTRSTAVATLMVIALTLLAGCTNPAQEAGMDQAPEARVAKALDRLLQAEDPAELGFTTFDAEVLPDEDGGTTFFSGDDPIHITWTEGANGVNHLEARIGEEGVLAQWCSDTHTVTQLGPQTVHARRGADTQCGLNSPSRTTDGGFPGSVADLELISAEALEDGGATALFAYSTPEGPAELGATVDADDRLVQVTFRDDSASGIFDLGYDDPGDVTLPEDAQRASLQISDQVTRDDEVYRWHALTSDAEADPAEIEVQVWEVHGDGPEDRTLVTTFDPAGEPTQQAAGFTFAYQDDGDGTFGTGDSFTITQPEGGTWSNGDLQVVVHDAWAGNPINEGPRLVPAPGILGLALAALLGTRRRTGQGTNVDQPGANDEDRLA